MPEREYDPTLQSPPERRSILSQGILRLRRLFVQVANIKTLRTNTITERTPAAGVIIDSVHLKDGVVVVGDVAFDDATSDPLIDADAASDGAENSVARKDHVHPKHHVQAHGASDHSGTIPTVRVYNTGAQTIEDGTSEALTFNSERFDTDGMHSTLSNTTRLTATTAGIYQITGMVRTPGAGRRFLWIRKDGSTNIGLQEWDEGSLTVMQVASLYELAATEYVELMIGNFSGGDFDTVVSNNYSPEFMMVWVGPAP